MSDAQGNLRFGAPENVVSATRSMQDADIVYLGQPPLRIDLLRAIDGVDTEGVFARAVAGRWSDLAIRVRTVSSRRGSHLHLRALSWSDNTAYVHSPPEARPCGRLLPIPARRLGQLVPGVAGEAHTTARGRYAHGPHRVSSITLEAVPPLALLAAAVELRLALAQTGVLRAHS